LDDYIVIQEDNDWGAGRPRTEVARRGESGIRTQFEQLDVRPDAA
jgi:hypothetical protein